MLFFVFVLFLLRKNVKTVERYEDNSRNNDLFQSPEAILGAIRDRISIGYEYRADTSIESIRA